MSLFISALLSATLLPGSSETLLLYKLSKGSAVLALVLSASVGNLLVHYAYVLNMPSGQHRAAPAGCV